MKKVIAIVLALVMAFSCSAICFAEDTTASAPAASSSTADTTANSLISSALGVVNQITSLLKANDVLSFVQSIINKLISLINGFNGSNAADVAGTIDELEAKIAELPIVGDILEYLHNLINTLKQKIKDLYSNSAETGAVAPVDTGSDASIGIVAFAAVSVAAAAAFVCTRKKSEDEE